MKDNKKKTIKTSDIFFIRNDQVDEELVINNENELKQLCGRKGYSLIQISPYDIPIPPYFIITSNVFEIVFSSLIQKIKKMTDKEILSLSDVKINIPKEVIKEIEAQYSKISGFSDAWVAIRPSIVLPESANSVNFSGQLETLLNIRGINNLTKAIEKVYTSMWNTKVLQFLLNNKVDITEIKLAIVVHKMIQSESAGISYSYNPISDNTNEILIESVFGLGNVIENNEITPDQYIVDKNTLNIVDKLIAPQEWMMVRDLKNSDSLHNDKKVEISVNWQRKQKLEDIIIKEIAELTRLLESGLNFNIEVEYVYSSGQIWILQIKKSTQPNINFVQDPIETEIKIEMPLLESKPIKDNTNNVELINTDHKTTLLTTTYTNDVKTITTGKALVISNTLLKDIDIIYTNLKTNDIVLVVEKLDNKLIFLLPKVLAIISDEGIISSDLSIEAVSKNIPILTNTYTATWNIKNGDYITVDSNEGKVYLAEKKPQEIVKEENIDKEIKYQKTVTQIWMDQNKDIIPSDIVSNKPISGVFSINLRDLTKTVNISPIDQSEKYNKKFEASLISKLLDLANKYYPKPMAISLDLPGSISFYQNLDTFPNKKQEINVIFEILRPILYSIKKLNTIHQKRNIWLTIENMRTINELNELITLIKNTQFKRSSMFKIGISISYPSLLYEISMFDIKEIDYIIIDLETLITQLYGNTKYLTEDNLLSTITSNIVENIKELAHEENVPVYIQSHSRSFISLKPILNKYATLGIDGFVIHQKLLENSLLEVNNTLFEIEKSLIK